MALNEYERFWNKLAQTEEHDLVDEKMNRLLRFTAMQQHLSGVRKILDVGAGTGAFSIPLAEMGYEVVHLDISDEMLSKAEEKARHLGNIRFMKADASNLDMFSTKEFDLVICFDGAISFSGSKANKVISEICRVGKKVMLSVSNKCCMVATWLNYSMEVLGHIHPCVTDMMTTGYFSKVNYPDADALTSITELKAYGTQELESVLVENGMTVLECRSISSLTHLYLMHLYRQYPAEIVTEKINAISADKEFLEICDYYDKNVMPDGMGGFARAGIFAIAE